MKHLKENHKKELFVRMCLFLTVILISVPGLVTGTAKFMDVKVMEEGSKIKIDFITDKPVIKYDSVTLDKPPSIVIDIYDTQCMEKELSIGRASITGINLIPQEGPKTRAVVGLIKLLPYQIQNLKNGIEVIIDNPYHGYQLTTIGVKEDESKISLSISSTSPPQYKYFDLSNPNRIVIDFLNAETQIGEVKLSSKLIKNILPSQRQVDPVNVARVIVELTEWTPYQVFSEGNQVILELTKSTPSIKGIEKISTLSSPPSKPPKEILPKVKEAPPIVKKIPSEIVRKKEGTEEKRIVKKATGVTKPTVQEVMPKEEIKPKEKIESTLSLDFKDADILDVLRLIAHKVGMNLFPGKDVKGMVTVKLDNVPWQKALDLILKNLGYAYIIEDNIIRVDSPTILLGDTTTRIFKLNYAKASDMVSIVTAMLTTLSSQQAKRMGGVIPVIGTIIQDARTNAVIVTDIPYNVNQIEEIIKKLDTMTPQVMIEAKIIEVTLDTRNAFGFMWSVGSPEGKNPKFTVGSYQTEGWPLGDRGEFVYSKITSGHALDVAIEALVTEGKANILSTPKILALDNETAAIVVGEDIPYQQTTKVQTGEVMSNVSFRSVGVKLSVTPHINPDGFVVLDVKPEVSSLKEWVGGMPVITTKEVTSKLVVKDGETIVIGGIIADAGTEKLNKVPLLGDLPFVGPLFRKKMTENRKTELLIFITPYIKKY
ncbi:MAG: AMIN domain-containing protein [Nitrospirota bacterium]